MKSINSLIILIIFWFVWGMKSETACAQSAIGQLEGLTGTTIDRSSTSSGIDYSEIWRARAEAAAERRAEAAERARVEAIRINELGNKAYSYGNWEQAKEYYRKALRYSPSDQVIKQNLQMAKDKLAYKKSQEKKTEQAQEQEAENKKQLEEQRQAFEKKKQPMLKLIQIQPVQHQMAQNPSSQKNSGSLNNSSFGSGDIPNRIQKIGGLTEQEWSEARNCQNEIDNLYKTWPVSAKDIPTLEALEIKRNNLWRKAINVPGLTATERERLKLKLYTADIYSKEQSASSNSRNQLREWKMTANQSSLSQANDNPKTSNISDQHQINSEITTLLSDLATDKATEMIEEAGEEYSKNSFGKKVGPLFGDALGVTKIIMSTSSEGVASGFAESIEFAIGKVKTPRAKLALEGSKIYLDYSQKAFDKFKEEVNRFNAEMGFGPVTEDK